MKIPPAHLPAFTLCANPTLGGKLPLRSKHWLLHNGLIERAYMLRTALGHDSIIYIHSKKGSEIYAANANVR